MFFPGWLEEESNLPYHRSDTKVKAIVKSTENKKMKVCL